MKRKPRVGLLPLYLKLYDERLPEMRVKLEGFLERVVLDLTVAGVEVYCGAISREAAEVAAAVRHLQTYDVDLLVTLHLAYSPSLEAAEALVNTELPLLMLDITMDYDFGREVDPQKLLYNHGIHGVQDLAAVLRRRGKQFRIVAGYAGFAETYRRTAAVAQAAHAARLFAKMRVLRIGPPFDGMGDFHVEIDVLAKKLGLVVDQIEPDDLTPDVEAVTAEEIEQELERDRQRFVCDLDKAVHRRTLRVALGLRRFLTKGNYQAFSMNFLAFNTGDGPVNTVPFLEASKAMARGIGYAGEGDVLTAALVGALAAAFGQVTFTEIFCPDWKGHSLFLSHMGEVNPDLAEEKPRLYEKPFPFTAAQNPAVATCALVQGPAVLVNLAPGPNDTFELIIAPVEVLGDGTHPDLKDWVRGWIRPSGKLGPFLETYSSLGGTHHSALVLGARKEAMQAFAEVVGLPYHVI